MSINDHPDFAYEPTLDDIEVLAGILARVPAAHPMQDVFRDDVREVVRLRATDLKACAHFTIGKMTEYDLLWIGAYHDDLQSLAWMVRNRVTMEELRQAARWFAGVYDEVRAAMGYRPL